MNSGFTLILRIVALCILAARVFAQTETGQIIGRVTDATSAVVANARVTLRAAGTGFTRQAATNVEGIYVFSNLHPAAVSAAAPGFASVEQHAVVTVGSNIRVNFELKVGDTRTVIPVAAPAVSVDVETQIVGSVVTGREILEFPTFSRNPYALVGTVGNISPADPSGAGVGHAINGQRASGTNVLLDGAANNDEFSAIVGQRVPLDAVREFSVVTNNLTAEYGRASSGVVNVVTKTRTNSLHGSLYEFGRYSALASNEFDNNASGIPKPVFTCNQFGYSAGGPLTKKLRDKVFFFTNTEWARVRSTSNTTVYIPTQDFINLAAPATQQFFQAYGQLRSGLTDLGTFTKSQFLAVAWPESVRHL